MRNLVTLRGLALMLATLPSAAVFAQQQPGLAQQQPGYYPMQSDLVPQDRIGTVRQLAHRLLMELERLQEDALVDVEGGNSREVYHQADRALRDVAQFERALRNDSPFENYARDYQMIHRNIRKTLEDVRAVNPNVQGLERDISRVKYAEQQLFFALTPQIAVPATPVNPATPIATDRQEQIHRLSEAATLEAQRFARTSRFVIENSPRGRQLQDAIQQYVAESQRFHQAFDRGERNRDLRREFAALDASWQNVITALNQMPQGEVYGLRRQADRIETTQEQLQTLFGVRAQRPEVNFEIPLNR